MKFMPSVLDNQRRTSIRGGRVCGRSEKSRPLEIQLGLEVFFLFLKKKNVYGFTLMNFRLGRNVSS